MSGLRLEKGYRDMGVDIDNTDNPIEAGLGFAVAWDKPGGFVGRDALLKAREQGPARHRVVSLVVDDPAADLFGNEPVLAGGAWAGYVRAAAYGYTVGGPVGLAQVANDDGVTGEWLKEADFRVRAPQGELPARLQIAPPYAAAAHPGPVIERRLRLRAAKGDSSRFTPTSSGTRSPTTGAAGSLPSGSLPGRVAYAAPGWGRCGTGRATSRAVSRISPRPSCHA
jgi:hypothetical protein